jgi:hypothetical protein
MATAQTIAKQPARERMLAAIARWQPRPLGWRRLAKPAIVVDKAARCASRAPRRGRVDGCSHRQGDGSRRHPTVAPRAIASTFYVDRRRSAMASRLLLLPSMPQLLSTSAVLLVLATTVGCVEPLPPAPLVTITSPKRGASQADAGQVAVTGTVTPAPGGAAVSTVTVNGIAATLNGDSFTATITMPVGLDLITTVAVAQDGGTATDTRAMEVGPLSPVGTTVPRAVTTSLSADAFAQIASAAGPAIAQMNLTSMLASMQPMATIGDDLANVQLSITKLTFSNVAVGLTPVSNGLKFSATIDGLAVEANAVTGGSLLPGGTTTVSATAAQVAISGTLDLQAAGSAGFTTTIGTPTVTTTGLELHASGLVGQAYSLLSGALGSTIQNIATTSAQSAMQPLMNQALGMLSGSQTFTVLGKTIAFTASPSVVSLTPAGATFTIDLGAVIEGSESSPGYLAMPTGTPSLNAGSGIVLAVADDLMNEMSSELVADGVLDVELQGNYDLFDTATFKPSLPPMIAPGANDGQLHFVLGDMIATFTDAGQPFATAAINAQVDVAVSPGTAANQIALQVGNVDLAIDILQAPAELTQDGLGDVVNAGISLQLASLDQFMVTVPVPSMAGVSLGNLALHGDSGYAVFAGQLH